MFDPDFSPRPRETRQWFQGSVLEPCISAYVQHLTTRGYAAASISMYVESVAHFAYWMRGKHLSRAELSERLVLLKAARKCTS